VATTRTALAKDARSDRFVELLHLFEDFVAWDHDWLARGVRELGKLDWIDRCLFQVGKLRESSLRVVFRRVAGRSGVLGQLVAAGAWSRARATGAAGGIRDGHRADWHRFVSIAETELDRHPGRQA
jgi:hypothetical protein